MQITSAVAPRIPELVLILLLGARTVCDASSRRADRDDDDYDYLEERQPRLAVPQRPRRGRHADALVDASNGNSLDYHRDRDERPLNADCDAVKFRRGQSECDRALHMNVPHHHRSHDYLCHSVLKYKVCVANVIVQSSCYERTFVSQELRKVKGVIQGYGASSCLNVTTATDRQVLNFRRRRFRMAKVKLSRKCNFGTAWSVEIACTRDFEADMKSVAKLAGSPRAIKKSCRTILRYYHCLTPVTESTSCQSNPNVVSDLEYFPNILTAPYKEACLKELDMSPSLLKDKAKGSPTVLNSAYQCKEEAASREFMACALVFNEVESKRKDQRTCEAYKVFERCTESIAQNLACGANTEFYGHAFQILSLLLEKYQKVCNFSKARGRSGMQNVTDTATQDTKLPLETTATRLQDLPTSSDFVYTVPPESQEQPAPEMNLLRRDRLVEENTFRHHRTRLGYQRRHVKVHRDAQD